MQDFTSLSPQEEQQFVVFERRSVNAGRAAATLAFIISGALLVVTVTVVLAFKPANMHNVVEEADQRAAAAAQAKETAKAAAATAAAEVKPAEEAPDEEKPAEAKPEEGKAGDKGKK